jgi:predicted amidophosphoribosyltransferase
MHHVFWFLFVFTHTHPLLFFSADHQCVNCHNALKAAALFCTKCGTKVAKRGGVEESSSSAGAKNSPAVIVFVVLVVVFVV